MLRVASLLVIAPVAAYASATQACAQGEVDGPCRVKEEEEAGALLQVQAGQAAVLKHSLGQAPDPDPSTPDQFGCSCGPNSPVANDGNCCDGTFNKKGENCFTWFNGELCKASEGNALCCKDSFNAWCCPSGTSCIPQTEGLFNDKSCTEEPPTEHPPFFVKSSWVIIGGGPGSPDMAISFTAGVTRAATTTEVEEMSNAFEVGFEFMGFKMSNTFTASWNTQMEKSVTTEVEISCSAQCPHNEYLWAYQTEFLGLETLPTEMRTIVAGCSAVVCSPFGMAKPPVCPFGFQADPENGFQCCASNAWLDEDELSKEGVPPVCSS